MASAWIERTFAKRECFRFVASRETGERCACGERRSLHRHTASASVDAAQSSWSISEDTRTCRTDVYGSIEFEGNAGPEALKFLRLDYSSRPKDIVQLLIHKWHFEAPRLVVSIIGCSVAQGLSASGEFHFPPRLQKALRKGFRKVVTTPGCWVIAEGSSTSVLRLIKEALIRKQASHMAAGNIVGISHWGTLSYKQQLVGRGIYVKRQRSSSLPIDGLSLSCSRKGLLLADDGNANRSGGEYLLRRNLECHLAERVGEVGLSSGAPVVCLLIGGSADAIHMVADYVTAVTPVPVVVCDGTGGCADLLAFACRLSTDKGDLNENQSAVLLAEIRKLICQPDSDITAAVYSSVRRCIQRRSLISTFTLSSMPTEDGKEKNLDSVVLAALLNGCDRSSFQEQLSLTISWSRPDLAKEHILRSDRWVSVNALHDAMQHALVHDKADFVNLLLDKGVNMKRFLTKERLEELYNVFPSNTGSRNTLDLLLKNKRTTKYHVTLNDIGQVINRLMGIGYRSTYKKSRSGRVMKKWRTSASHTSNERNATRADDEKTHVFFEFPHNELMMWAILTDRKKLPKLMWRREQEVLAKAVVACKLYTALASELEDSSQIDRLIMADYRLQANKFQERAIETLDMCYRYDSEMSKHLLCCQLSNWSNQNVLSLAYSAGMKEFVAHACCQSVITQLWLGGLTLNKQASLKILCGICLPPTIGLLCFQEQFSRTVRDIGKATFVNEAFDVSDCYDSSKDEDLRSPQHSMGPVLLNGRRFNDVDGRIERTALVNGSEALRKLKTFYCAPITKFWMHTIAFCAFLLTLSYTVVIRMERRPHWSEVFCILYVVFLFMEMVREISNYPYHSLTKRLWSFFGDMWNLFDTAGSLLFLVGAILRFQDDELMLLTGKHLYCLSIVIWYIRMLENLSMNRTIGYFTAVMMRMTTIVFKFCILTIILIFGFGIPKQGILFPKREASWELLRNVTMKPYFILYGEVFKKELEDICSEYSDDDKCVPGYWLHPWLEAIYLLIGIPAIMHVLFTWINIDYQQVSEDCDKFWMFQRYSLVVGCRDTLAFPPPLTCVSYIYLLVSRCFKRLKTEAPTSTGYGCRLSLKQLDYLRWFEEQCVVEGLVEKDKVAHTNMKKKAKSTYNRMCELSAALSARQNTFGLTKKAAAIASAESDVKDIESSIEQMLVAAQAMDKQMTTLETLAQQRLQLVRQLADLVLLRGLPPSSDSGNAFAPVAAQPTSPAANQQPATMTAAISSAEVLLKHEPKATSSANMTNLESAVVLSERLVDEQAVGQSERHSAADKHDRSISRAGHVDGPCGCRDSLSSEAFDQSPEIPIARTCSNGSEKDVPTLSDTLQPVRHEELLVSSCPEHVHEDLLVSSCPEHVHEDLLVSSCPEHVHEELLVSSCREHAHKELLVSSCPEHVHKELLVSSCPEHVHEELLVSSCPEHVDANSIVAGEAALLNDNCGETTHGLVCDTSSAGQTECDSPTSTTFGVRAPEATLPSSLPECRHPVRPTWLSLGVARPPLLHSDTHRELLPTEATNDVEVTVLTPNLDAGRSVEDEEELLRCVEESAAAIIGERLQDKMSAMAAESTPLERRDVAAAVLPGSVRNPPLLSVSEVDCHHATTGDVIFCALSDEENVGDAAPLGNANVVRSALSRELVAVDEQPGLCGSRSDGRETNLAPTKLSFLLVPDTFGAPRHSLASSDDDEAVLLRSLSEHSISSMAQSELSAHTETSFVVD